MVCVDPVATDWIFHLDLSHTDANKRTSILKDSAQLLEKGIEGIGKTKAYASLEVIQEPNTIFSKVLPTTFDASFTVNVLLVTQARMLPHQLERLLKGKPAGQQSDSTLGLLYQNYWQNQSNNGLSVVRYFARQQRYGSEYAKRHYQGSSTYAPEWITEAGSIFVLNVENQQGLDCLKSWERVGLPAALNADGTAATWQTTAFIPENGYGEICINWNMLAQYHSPQTGYVLPKKEAK